MSQILILKICAVIIVVGLIILGIDKFIVRGDEPTEQQRVEQLSDDLSLDDLSNDEALKQRMTEILSSHQDITGRGIEVSKVLGRNDEAARLWLVEFSSREFALYRSGGLSSNVDITRLAIVMEFGQGAALPTWSQENSEASTPLNAEALERLQRMDDYRMAMGSNHVLFASQLETFALLQASNQSVSSEFHAGLLNSALQIDVQRAVDIVNLLDADLPQVARFYTIDVPKPNITVPDASKISAGIDDIAKQMEQDRAAMREEWERQDAERKAQWEAAQVAIREKSEQRSAARKADNEQRSAARKAEREKRMAEIRQRMENARDKAKAVDPGNDEPSEQ